MVQLYVLWHGTFKVSLTLLVLGSFDESVTSKDELSEQLNCFVQSSCKKFLWHSKDMPSFYIYSLLAARIAPVMAPLVIEFQGSSFPRTFTKLQSIIEKSPPHTAKLPTTQNKQDTVKTWLHLVSLFCHCLSIYIDISLVSNTQQL